MDENKKRALDAAILKSKKILARVQSCVWEILMQWEMWK